MFVCIRALLRGARRWADSVVCEVRDVRNVGVGVGAELWRWCVVAQRCSFGRFLR